MDSDSSIEIVESDCLNRLILTGILDTRAAAEVHAAATRLSAAARDVAVDWHGASQMGPAVLQVLLALKLSLAAQGRLLEIAADNPEIRRTLQLAGLAAALPNRNEA